MALAVVLAGTEAEARQASPRDIHEAVTTQAVAEASLPPKPAETIAPVADELDDILF